jgi:very-short-patch-repair endonuclease
MLQDLRLRALVRDQHGVVTRAQLLEFGYTHDAIKHAARSGALHVVARGVYVLGRRSVSRLGGWMAAVLSCGPQAMLSHGSAMELLGVEGYEPSIIEVTVPADQVRRRPGVRVHRCTVARRDVVTMSNIRATGPVRTLLDLANRLSAHQLERAINELDGLDLVDPTELRADLDQRPGQRGVRALRSLLDRRAFRLTDSELERMFLRLVRTAGLPGPQTQVQVNGFRVDFFWPEVGLVVETDGLRYHRTPVQQAKDRLRDQVHTQTDVTPLRFTHAQIKYEPARVRQVLVDVYRRLLRRREALGAL